MNVKVDEIDDAGVLLKESKDACFFPVLQEIVEQKTCSFLLPVASRLLFSRLPDGDIKLEGSVETRIGQTCDRCLVAFEYPLKTGFSLIFSCKTAGQEVAAEVYELRPKDIDTVFFTGDTLMLTDIIQEQVVLSLPYRSICRSGCKGLCQNCGENLNKKDCGCSVSSGHPAFGALASLGKKRGR